MTISIWVLSVVIAAYVAALLAAHDSRDGRDWTSRSTC
jgi:hypothetical protein